MADNISSSPNKKNELSKQTFTSFAAPAHEPSADLDHYEGDPSTTKKELYSYYAYYAGNNGIGSFQYSNLLFQNLIYQAAFNPNIHPLGSVSCDANPSAPCHVFWNGGTKAYASVILIGSGLTFLFQAIVFLCVGSLADYGNWNPWVVRVFSVLTWAFEFGFLGVKRANQWDTAMALYIISGVTFWSSYIFFNAIFPKLAHDMPEARAAKRELREEKISDDKYQRTCSLLRSRVVNISYGWNNVGFVVSAALSLAALAGLHADDSPTQNNWGYAVAVAVCTGFWISLAIPWFLWEKKRPGPPLPKGDNYLSFGFRQIWFAAKQAWMLKQTFLYLISFFLLADGINTTWSLVMIVETQYVEFSAMQNTYFILVQGASTAIGVFGAYYIQRYFNFRNKTMLQAMNIGCVVVALWGMVGIWTDKFGFHNGWEFWLFNAQFGLTIGPQFSYGQAFMSELVPHGREYMFFGLLGIVNKGSAWIGPIVSSAIVDRSGNEWTPFPFTAALTLVPTIAIFFISEAKSREECTEYLAREASGLRKVGMDEKSA